MIGNSRSIMSCNVHYSVVQYIIVSYTILYGYIVHYSGISYFIVLYSIL